MFKATGSHKIASNRIIYLCCHVYCGLASVGLDFSDSKQLKSKVTLASFSPIMCFGLD